MANLHLATRTPTTERGLIHKDFIRATYVIEKQKKLISRLKRQAC